MTPILGIIIFLVLFAIIMIAVGFYIRLGILETPTFRSLVAQERIGEGASFLRTRLALPVLAEDGSAAAIEPRLSSLLRYRHLPPRDRFRIPLVTARCRCSWNMRSIGSGATSSPTRTSCWCRLEPARSRRR